MKKLFYRLSRAFNPYPAPWIDLWRFRYRSSSMHEAVKLGDPKRISRLLAWGYELDMYDSDGGTPLHLAAFLGSAEIVRLLIEAGANVHAELKDELADEEDRVTPLALAVAADVNSEEYKELFSPSSASFSPNHLAVVKLLLAEGADVHVVTLWGAITREQGRADLVKVLLDAGADVDAREELRRRDGRTPLHCAADWGHLEVVGVLLAAGADVNAKADDGSTPLGLAECGGHSGIARLLRDHGGVV